MIGWQWRRAGEDYDQRHCSSRTPGFDQIAEMVRLIKDDPNSRRIFMTAWNVKDLDKMALVPCHVSVQFHVAKGILHTTMYQRSADMGLGVPYNIASYALLTHMLCHLCDLQPGVLTMNLGDVHVYHNHVEPLMLQLCRKRKPLPTLLIKESVSNIDDFDEHHFQLIGYDHYAAIKMQMAV